MAYALLRGAALSNMTRVVASPAHPLWLEGITDKENPAALRRGDPLDVLASDYYDLL